MGALQVLSVASEIFPLVKTGGLADVVGALPRALAAERVSIRSLVPGYPAVLEQLQQGEPAASLPDLFGGEARLTAGEAAGLALFVIDAPHLYRRAGGPYIGPDGRDWPDNAERFAALALVAAGIGQGLVPGYVPDLIHAHDWQAGLTPAYLHFAEGRRPGTLITIHNLAFQGVFPADLLERLRLPPQSFSIDGVEYYGGLSFLKAGIQYADRITTVSPSYALEIQTDDGGVGLGGLLRARSSVLSGILNGIDTQVWDPARDPLLAETFDVRRVQARSANKAALQDRLRLARDPGLLLLGVIGRLTRQKGLDLLLSGLPSVIGRDAQLVLLGAGERDLEDGFAAAAERHAGRVGVLLGYDEPLAHLIQGGSDAILVPSRFEPCGLTQLCALRYGAVPVAARVGGLADTIIDANEMAQAAGVATGIQFAPVTGDGLAAAIARTKALWRDPLGWKQIQRNGMKTEVGWSRSARRYGQLYAAVISQAAPEDRAAMTRFPRHSGAAKPSREV